ncbi:TPR-like protein [Auriscalpium vulgare]|uniref:TPR-like protein n=1 Tax=Auriscalpium vulgare TaxID=40419 RepID=A0ACB8RV96_9AGAM|nr:TPR-like protein [Auriscalpium vulgare]
MSEKKQQLVLSIIDFLNKSIEDGTVKQDDKESLEVAVQCIGEAFGVDPSDEQQVGRLSVKPATLPTIFDVYLKTRDKIGSQSAPAAPTPASVPKGPSADDKAKAEKAKQQGNALMSSKKYDEAIAAYTEAIEIDPINAIYYSNRAAAYSSKADHYSAILDAEKAIEVDPSFVKAYSRLGHAQYSVADYNAAAAAFRRGLELDPSNASLKSGLQNSEARIESDEPAAVSPPRAASPPGAGAAGGMGGLADMLQGLGGGAGGAGGGMPDIASLMNNPMMMQMAQQMMANGGMERLMQNPSVANMMNRVNSGGGMPSMEELMGDPSLRDMYDICILLFSVLLMGFPTVFQCQPIRRRWPKVIGTSSFT